MSLKQRVRRSLKKLLSSMSLDQRAQAPVDANAEFHLSFHGSVVGILAAKDGRWVFRYADDFRRKRDISPLMIFPDVDKVYESRDLWPFFRMRVPSLKQPSIRAIVVREHIDENDQVQLLRRFGRRTITNPFELVAADPGDKH